MESVPEPQPIDVVVIGAGQSGLSAAYHLGRAQWSYVLFDAGSTAGGAWRHRWPSLTLGRTHRLHDLPGLALPPTRPDVAASRVVTDYFSLYEETFNYRAATDLAGGHVVVVGGGASAVQLLLEIAAVTITTWVTRRTPVWREGPFGEAAGRHAVSLAAAATREGRPLPSIVSTTGLMRIDGSDEGPVDAWVVPRDRAVARECVASRIG